MAKYNHWWLCSAPKDVIKSGLRERFGNDAVVDVDDYNAACAEIENAYLAKANAYAIKVKDALRDMGYDPDAFAELSPALAIAALTFEVK